jgi:glucokinase
MKIGMDIGGTNLRAATLADDGSTVTQLREPIGEPRDPDTIIERVAKVAEQLAGDHPGPIPVGIGIAAMLRDYQGTVANSPHLRWRDVPFGKPLAARLGSRFALGVYNDVNAVTWGEAAAGAARGCRDVLAVYIGTGIGGGVIAGGRLVEGASNCAGEIGHVKVVWDDTAVPCMCGRRGCVEAYVGGSYVERRIIRELAGTSPSGADAGARGSMTRGRSRATFFARGFPQVTPAHVEQAAADGDEWALALWSELASLFAIAVGNAIAVLNPERVVLGGGLLMNSPTLFELAVTAIEVATPGPSLEPLSIVPAELGDFAGVVGAAELAAAEQSIIRPEP